MSAIVAGRLVVILVTSVCAVIWMTLVALLSKMDAADRRNDELGGISERPRNLGA